MVPALRTVREGRGTHSPVASAIQRLGRPAPTFTPLDEVLAAIQKSKAKVVMPLKEQFYGMREFAFEDPEGWIVTIAEPIRK